MLLLLVSSLFIGNHALNRVPCTDFNNWKWNDVKKVLKTCTLSALESDEEFVIAADVDNSVLAFDASDDKNLKRIPSLVSVFPSLVVVQFMNVSVKTLDDESFKSLWKLRSLSLSRNQIEFVTKDNFKDLVSLEYLYLSTNKIEFIAAGAFDSLVNLKRLKLQNNEIQHFQSKLFNSLENLEELVISDNKISFLHPDTFKALVKVENINMNQNDIWNLPEDLFATLVELQNISFAGNNLVQIPYKLFTMNPKLEKIWMDQNKIKYVNPEMFKNLSSLKYVDLLNNECIKKLYRTPNFEAMQSDLKEHCSDPEVKKDERMKSLEAQIAVLAEKLSELQNLANLKAQEVAVVFQ